MSGRAATLEDAAAIAALLNELAEFEGAGWTDEQEIRSWLTLPDADPENSRVFEQDGSLAAYADVYDAGDGRVWIDVRARPGSLLELDALAWGEERAGALGAEAIRAQALAGSTLAALAAERGYRTVRHSFQMRIELADEPPAPTWSEGIEVRTLRPGEERAVHAASEEAFADHWEHAPEPFDRWLHLLSADGRDPELWFLAVEGGEIAGVCLCGENARAGGPTGWVHTLGVRPAWRRRGLGRALLLHAFRVLRARGLPVAALGVDGENTTGAVRLYERAGMHVARRWETWQLEPGGGS